MRQTEPLLLQILHSNKCLKGISNMAKIELLVSPSHLYTIQFCYAMLFPLPKSSPLPPHHPLPLNMYSGAQANNLEVILYLLFSQIPNIQTISKSHFLYLQNTSCLGPLLSISPATTLESPLPSPPGLLSYLHAL